MCIHPCLLTPSRQQPNVEQRDVKYATKISLFAEDVSSYKCDQDILRLSQRHRSNPLPLCKGAKGGFNPFRREILSYLRKCYNSCKVPSKSEGVLPAIGQIFLHLLYMGKLEHR